jgi:hypothetical protein
MFVSKHRINPEIYVLYKKVRSSKKKVSRSGLWSHAEGRGSGWPIIIHRFYRTDWNKFRREGGQFNCFIVWQLWQMMSLWDSDSKSIEYCYKVYKRPLYYRIADTIIAIPDINSIGPNNFRNRLRKNVTNLLLEVSLLFLFSECISRPNLFGV